MKKLLGILVISLLWCNFAEAEINSIKYICTDVNSPAIPLSLQLVYGEGHSFGLLGEAVFKLEVYENFYELTLDPSKTENLTGGHLFVNKISGVFQGELDMAKGSILKLQGTCEAK